MQDHPGNAEEIKDAERDAEDGQVGVSDTESREEQEHQARVVERALHGVQRIGDERVAPLMQHLQAGRKTAQVDEAGLHGEDVDGAPCGDPAAGEGEKENCGEKKPRDQGDDRPHR